MNFKPMFYFLYAMLFWANFSLAMPDKNFSDLNSINLEMEEFFEKYKNQINSSEEDLNEIKELHRKKFGSDFFERRMKDLQRFLEN